MVNVFIFLMATIVLIGTTNGPLGQAISWFLLAGIIPGTSIQLPWYFIFTTAPLLAYGIYRFFYTYTIVNRKLAVLHESADQKSIKAKSTSKKISSVGKIKKAYAHARSKQAKNTELSHESA